MKNGFKIYDTDTHVRPMIETLSQYYDPNIRARMPELEKFKRENKRDVEGMIPGRHSYALGERIAYSRMLGEAEPAPGHFAPRSKYMGTRHATRGAIDDDPGSVRGIPGPRNDGELRHRADRGQRLAAEAQGRDRVQVVVRQLRGRVAVDREREIFRRHAAAVEIGRAHV